MRRLRILVACEYSGKVREAFRKLGHDAWSYDLIASEDDSPHHIIGNVLPALNNSWDAIIAFPPCTRLTNSGVRWLSVPPRGKTKEEMWADLESACAFFSAFLNADCNHIAVENPIMHKHAKALIQGYFEPGQPIQPWMFGHTEIKATCLWRKGLPALVPTKDVYAETMRIPYGERARVHYASPGVNRWKERSRTKQGIADAMAQQWSAHLLSVLS